VLDPFDVVYVRRSPLYRNQSNVVIEGEVKFPGKYALRSGNDRISDLLGRAGGLTQFAFPAGTILIRNIYTGNTPSDTVIRSLKYALLDANTTIEQQEPNTEKQWRDSDSLGARIISKQLNSQQKRVALDLNEALKKTRSSCRYPTGRWRYYQNSCGATDYPVIWSHQLSATDYLQIWHEFEKCN